MKKQEINHHAKKQEANHYAINNSIHVVDKIESNQPKVDSNRPKVLKTDEKLMAEVEDMLLAKLQQKTIKWKYDYDHADSFNEDSTSTDEKLEGHDTMAPNPILLEDFKKLNDAYATLMESSNDKEEIDKDSSPSLLLPAFVPPMEKVEVFVKESNDVLEKMAAKQYIESLREERQAAIRSARLYRSQIDELRKKNRKLHREMHDKIDTIRDFWRNNIAEGSSRAGLCVKLAIQKPSK